MDKPIRERLFGAAVLKMSFQQKQMTENPGFRVVYFGTLNDLGLTDDQVDAFIDEHRAELEAHIRHQKPTKA